MKRNNRGSATVVGGDETDGRPAAGEKRNGNSVLVDQSAPQDLSAILASLQTMRDGDFSVRLPGSWTGI